jgi:hypothetical protein
MPMGDAMNDADLIDYALGQVEELECREIERALDDDPIERDRLLRVRAALHELLDDGAWAEPAPDLARRTVAYVAKNRRRAAPLFEQVPVRMPFRWADLAVAASIFIAGLLTLAPAIQRSKERMNQAGCVFNLQQLGTSLAQYASLHPFLPYPPQQRSDTHAGMFAALLSDAGLLHDVSILDCPANGVCPGGMRQLASFEQVDRVRRTDPEQYRGMLCWDYAYNVGYRHDGGRPGPIEAIHSSRLPLLADQPNHLNFLIIREGNSPNHGGLGQNVLFGDGSVRWFITRHIAPFDPDLYLNNEQQLRPGVHVYDSVLVPSKSPFLGSQNVDGN